MSTADSASLGPSIAGRAPERVLCAHCRLPVPAGLVDANSDEQFCCAGCRAVYETIHACGLDSYYRLVASTNGSLAPAQAAETSFDAFDAPAFGQLYVETLPDGACMTDLVLEGVTCAACVWLVEKLPRVLPGVIEARLSLRESVVRITWDPQSVALSRIAMTLSSFGYHAHPARGQSRKELHRRENRRRLIHMGIAGAIMGNVMLLAFALYAGWTGDMEEQYRVLFRYVSMGLALIALAWPGGTFFRSALAALRARTVNLDQPIALALLAGGTAGLVNVILNRGDIYFDSLTVLVFLLLVGRWMQFRQQRSADDAVELLFSLTPTTCRIVHANGVIEAPVEALKPGDLVEVRPGDLLPADGVVESGGSSINQALLTGESMPAAIAAGGHVHAGSQNIQSPLRVRVGTVGAETRIGQLMKLIERGVMDKPPIVQFADRVSLWFIVAVTLAAAGVFAFWSTRSLAGAVDHAVALLIVTCPCVLGLTTPLTISIAIGRLARRDILVKSGAAIERLSRGGRLLLDKTGTLTTGQMTLNAWKGDRSIQPAVACLERHSSHPVAAVLAALAPEADVPLTQIVERPGGISAVLEDGSVLRVGSPAYIERELGTAPEAGSAGTRVLIAVDERVIASATFGDELCTDTPAAIESLRRAGFVPSILSGDAPGAVEAVSRRLAVVDARAQCTPEQKLEAVNAGRGASGQPGGAASRATVMVGDGVNDAAALAAADVGIAVHGGAEASLSAADVYIARPGLAPLVDLVQTSRQTMRVIRRNLAISLAYNLVAGGLAAAGLMNPLIAAILMPVSSASVLSMVMFSVARRKGA